MGASVTDRPRPGTGYLMLLIALTCLGCVTTGLIATELRGAGLREWVAAIASLSCMAGLVLATVHAALRTRYEISDRELRLRSGFVMRAAICRSDVAAVERVGFMPRVLGWGGGRGLANRLTDGLRITLRSGAVYYVSPSDPAAFSARVVADASEHEVSPATRPH